MIKTRLFGRNNKEVHTASPYEGFPTTPVGDEILVTVGFPGIHGVFKSVTRDEAGTTTITGPILGQSILLTDLLISGEKQAGSTVEVRFTDGTNTVTIFSASQVDAPPNFAHSFVGRIQGWADARLDMITSGAGDATVMVGYVKIPSGIPFSEWDSFR